MQEALPAAPPTTRFGRLAQTTLRALLLTLLFLPVVGLRRTWDLRSYSGDALALLTARGWAYGYRHVERFLSWLAHTGAAARFTDALARWTSLLWHPATTEPAAPTYYYIDGHRKPVFSDRRIPRGLIGRTGAIEGCRALVLLHDAQGHPLLATTHRGDQHLTIGLPHILARYTEATGGQTIEHLVVDREGMGGDFLAGLVATGCTVVTILRADQYDGLASFCDIGDFVPLVRDRHGNVIREVAPARFALTIPGRGGEKLPLSVALIRDLRCQVAASAPVASDDDIDDPAWVPSDSWKVGLSLEQQRWWSLDWVATPMPATSTEARLIPIVTTAAECNAVALAELYTARWPLQENIIRDFLIPLGLDTNHGYAKTPVENSEVAKQRTTLEQRRERLQRWAESARKRYRQAERRSNRRYEHYKEQREVQYRELNRHQSVLYEQEVDDVLRQMIIRKQKAEIDAALELLVEQYRRADGEYRTEGRKIERYCAEQRVVLRQLEDLNAREQQMYELNNDKDQVMTVCKVALANLAMWTRDRFFPSDYAQATWKRLVPFFELPGRVSWERSTVRVELRPFNDRKLTRDLIALCERVCEQAPHLPDGRRLVLSVAPAPSRNSDLHQRC